MPAGVQKFRQNKKKQAHLEKSQQIFESSFKEVDPDVLDADIRVPPIIYVANKAEDDFEGDIEEIFYKFQEFNPKKET
jgi:hypothetical protein